MLDPQWDDAIRRALAHDPRATVFVETRSDLSVVATGSDDTEIVSTAWGGAGLERGEGTFAFHADLVPDGLAALYDGRTVPRGGQRPPPVDPWPAREAATQIVTESRRRHPNGTYRARWVESDQQVWVGARGAVVTDRRRTRRLRLEGFRVRGVREAWAVAEGVVGHPNSRARDLVQEVVERLEARLDVRDPPTGPQTIVFAPAVAGIWVHELVGHAAEADRVVDNRSWLAHATDRLPSVLTVVDDPRRARAAWRYDDEGSAVREVTLIREGWPGDLLHSRRTSTRCGAGASGHARRASFRERVLPRMGCTFIQRGEDDPDEILQRVKQGIYVRRMESAHTDPVTGRAVFRVIDADRIVEGRLGSPLRTHLLETLAPQALAAIDGIGNDLEFDRCIGTCHRAGQPLSTSVGAPTICTRLMTVRS